VLVGAEPKRQSFTVHHDIITKRSGFFRAARSEHWTSDKSKPVDLQHCDPTVFAHYLHCVYRGEVPFFDIYGDGQEINGQYTMKEMCREPDIANEYYEYLVKLYITADSLQDPITANLVIDEVRRISQRACIPGGSALTLAFDQTLEGDGLRNVLADIVIVCGDEYDDGVDHSIDFLKLVMKRSKTVRSTTREVQAATEEVGDETLWAFGGDEDWVRCEYHQKPEGVQK
jgi:hypothetical protein